jgi:hypothetical protein
VLGGTARHRARLGRRRRRVRPGGLTRWRGTSSPSPSRTSERS